MRSRAFGQNGCLQADATFVQLYPSNVWRPRTRYLYKSAADYWAGVLPALNSLGSDQSLFIGHEFSPLSFANNRSGQKVAMPRYVHIGDGGRRVVEWRQSFPLLVPLDETDTACPGSGAFSIHGSSGNRKTAFSSDGGRLG